MPRLTDVLQSYNIRTLRNLVDQHEERLTDIEARLINLEGPPAPPIPAPPGE